MKKLRKVNKAKRKRERKEAQQLLANRASLMMNHPKECCVCNTEFARTRETVKTWNVTVAEDRVRLTCPKCWATLIKEMERIENAI